MRVLLDENLPKKLKRAFDKDVVAMTVAERGWAGVGNGELLKTAQAVYYDRQTNTAHQQNLKSLDLGVVVLGVRSNRYSDLIPLMPQLSTILRSIKPGDLVRVKA